MKWLWCKLAGHKWSTYHLVEFSVFLCERCGYEKPCRLPIIAKSLVADVDLGPPPNNGATWQFGARPSDALDAANIEIMVNPENDTLCGDECLDPGGYCGGSDCLAEK